MWLVWGFAQWASEQEKLSAQHGNLLVSDCRTEVFSALKIIKNAFFAMYTQHKISSGGGVV